MIQVLMGKRGSGKTMLMIEHANSKSENSNGHIVFIDNEDSPMLRLGKKIRFVNTNTFDISNFSSLYGLVCGIISENYDTDTIYIDNILNEFDFDFQHNQNDFEKLVKVAEENKLHLIFSVNEEVNPPEYITIFKQDELV